MKPSIKPLAGVVLRESRFHGEGGYLLMEALVYIGLVFLLLGIGSSALYRMIDNSVALRRNAADILAAIHVGELWRADVRGASRNIGWGNVEGQPTLQLVGAKGEIDYRLADGALYRRIGTGPWSRVLERIKSSSMEPEARPNVIVWRWELELQTQARASFKPGRTRPLFTFLTAPTNQPSP